MWGIAYTAGSLSGGGRSWGNFWKNLGPPAKQTLRDCILERLWISPYLGYCADVASSPLMTLQSAEEGSHGRWGTWSCDHQWRPYRALQTAVGYFWLVFSFDKWYANFIFLFSLGQWVMSAEYPVLILPMKKCCSEAFFQSNAEILKVAYYLHVK